MRTINVIGIGAGSPKHITLEAIEALQHSDAVIALDKGDTKQDLLALRQTIVDTHAPGTPIHAVTDPERDRNPTNYRQEVARWHSARAQLLADTIRTNTTDNSTIAFLVWGDPSLYDSTLRIIERMRRECHLDAHVHTIPGITAIHALTAAHNILINRVGEAIHITTGRNLPNETPNNRRNIIVMLDGGTAWQDVAGDNTYIYWGAYLGTEHQTLRHGWARDIGEELATLKQQLRQQHGWIMDTYLLREMDHHTQPTATT
ncbi:precorrin-6A synthase (deacetylating) [Corynebacterium aquilae]|uniref:Precorrin 6A synthase n=1 Tax=Corynebacterium aquilae DSM 44791 TaxID=1431546 RepID=A0A1L7CDE0_9CORY|nr:precorrin-6A synthase (deacetylating) [Corynebacterium aquilae]APT83844.1 precorrin 6A synthase [Corynebacterium aquilae DSM 44791]